MSPSTHQPTKLEEATRLLAQLTKLLDESDSLTPKERLRALKMPRGGDAIVRTLAALSDRARVKLPYTTATMLADLAEADSLVALHSELALATKLVDDRIFSAKTRCWTAATSHYTVLLRISRQDGEIQTMLASVRAFFARPRKKKAEAEAAGEGSPAAESSASSSAGAKTTDE